MNILLLGATGRTGKLVLETALTHGHQVHCLARNSKRIHPQEGLSVFDGDVLHEHDLRKAISGCEAIISVLNISRRSDFPWSRLRTPKQFLSDMMRLVIPIAEEHNLKRIAICSAWGVAETRLDIPTWFDWLIRYSNIGIAYKDHERQERILAESDLDWTIVRPVGLSHSTQAEQIQETFDKVPKPSFLISRRSVATYLVNSLSDKALIRKKVTISKA